MVSLLLLAIGVAVVAAQQTHTGIVMIDTDGSTSVRGVVFAPETNTSVQLTGIQLGLTNNITQMGYMYAAIPGHIDDKGFLVQAQMGGPGAIDFIWDPADNNPNNLHVIDFTPVRGSSYMSNVIILGAAAINDPYNTAITSQSLLVLAQNQSNSYDNYTMIYDPVNRVWSQKYPGLPTVLDQSGMPSQCYMGFAMATLGGEVYIIAGQCSGMGAALDNTMWKFDTSTPTPSWQPIGMAPNITYMVMYGTQIVTKVSETQVVGCAMNQTTGPYYYDCAFYDLNTNSWTYTHSLNLSSYQIMSQNIVLVTYNNEIYAIIQGQAPDSVSYVYYIFKHTTTGWAQNGTANMTNSPSMAFVAYQMVGNGNCQYTPWSQWACSVCNHTADTGYYVRNRTLVNGTNCQSCVTQINSTVACGSQICPVNCILSNWSVSYCNVSCGSGFTVRNRTVVSPALYGGTCIGDLLTVEGTCTSTRACPLRGFLVNDAVLGLQYMNLVENYTYTGFSSAFPVTPACTTCPFIGPTYNKAVKIGNLGYFINSTGGYITINVLTNTTALVAKNFLQARANFSLTQIGGQPFVCGGNIAGQPLKAISSCELYATLTSAWTANGVQPVNSTNAKMTTLNGNPYLFGGYNAPSWSMPSPVTILNKAYAFNPTTKVFTLVDPMPMALYSFGIVNITADCALICGGLNSTNEASDIDKCWYYMASIDFFFPGAAMNVKRHNHVLATWNGYSYAIGGKNGTSTDALPLEILTPQGWKIYNPIGYQAPMNVSAFGAVAMALPWQ